MSLKAADIAASPRLYPHQLDLARNRLMLLRLTQADYRAASFLDDRMATPDMVVGWAPAASLAVAAKAIRQRPLHFIFHTGHVGSTLLSRLLDEAPGVLGLREPLPLRTLAEEGVANAADAAHLDLMLHLWSRGFDDTQTVVVKATSSAGHFAPRLLQASPRSHAVYLYLKAEPCLATLLAGENTVTDLAAFAPMRARRVAAQLGEALPAITGPGETAALAFLAENLARQASAGPRVLMLDFDALLAGLEIGLAAVLAHFGRPLPPETIRHLAASPTLGRYSKAPEQAYSQGLRAAVLAEARQKAGGEIRKGLAWLEEIARQHSAIAALL
jgi:hypothetical protein